MINIMAISSSVLIPVHRVDDNFFEMVDSLLVNSREKMTEFVFVLNGSALAHEATIINVLSSLNLNFKVVKTFFENLSEILNVGLSECTSDYVVRMDSDDVMRGLRVERLVSLLIENPRSVLVFSDVCLIDQNSKPLRTLVLPNTSKEIKAKLRFGNALPHPAVAFRKSIVLGAGGYRNVFPYAEDYDLWRRLEKFGTFEKVDKVLLDYRIHNDQISSRFLNEQDKSTWEIVLENEILNGNLKLDTDFARVETGFGRFRFLFASRYGIAPVRSYYPLSNKYFVTYSEVLIRRAIARLPQIGFRGICFLFIAFVLSPGTFVKRAVRLLTGN
jgi:glycosyltransferase involved in cell wall biosynthesis